MVTEAPALQTEPQSSAPETPEQRGARLAKELISEMSGSLAREPARFELFTYKAGEKESRGLTFKDRLRVFPVMANDWSFVAMEEKQTDGTWIPLELTRSEAGDGVNAGALGKAYNKFSGYYNQEKARQIARLMVAEMAARPETCKAESVKKTYVFFAEPTDLKNWIVTFPEGRRIRSRHTKRACEVYFIERHEGLDWVTVAADADDSDRISTLLRKAVNLLHNKDSHGLNALAASNPPHALAHKYGIGADLPRVAVAMPALPSPSGALMVASGRASADANAGEQAIRAMADRHLKIKKIDTMAEALTFGDDVLDSFAARTGAQAGRMIELGRTAAQARAPFDVVRALMEGQGGGASRNLSKARRAFISIAYFLTPFEPPEQDSARQNLSEKFTKVGADLRQGREDLVRAVTESELDATLYGVYAEVFDSLRDKARALSEARADPRVKESLEQQAGLLSVSGSTARMAAATAKMVERDMARAAHCMAALGLNVLPGLATSFTLAAAGALAQGAGKTLQSSRALEIQAKMATEDLLSGTTQIQEAILTLEDPREKTALLVDFTRRLAGEGETVLRRVGSGGPSV